MSSSRATSVCTNKALPPAEVISRATFSPSATRRPETTTFAPSLANARAVALPMPEVPPVMRTVLFSKVFIVGPSVANVDRIYPGRTLRLMGSSQMGLLNVATSEHKRFGPITSLVFGPH